MTCTYVLMILPLSAIACGAWAQSDTGADWQASVGAGVAVVPVYEGSDNDRVMAIPAVRVSYKNMVTLGQDGLMVKAYENDRLKLEAGLGYQPGRDESDDHVNLRGMGDVDGAALAKVGASYILGDTPVGRAEAGVMAAQGLNGDYGTTVEGKLGLKRPLTDCLSIGGDVHATWASDTHMETYFGVSSAQSARSGKAAYAPEAGIKSYGVALNGTYKITNAWQSFAKVQVNQLTGDAADSPIVQREWQPSAVVGLMYKF
jgi:outer membrane scaffolding protein for murein synthesis (MipA/OmpV family)